MIRMENFVYDGHPMLRTVVKEIQIPITDEDKLLMQQMQEYLRNSQNQKIAKRFKLKEGVGLAAPQLGKDKRIFALRAEDSSGVTHEYVLANPKIISHSEAITYLKDGEGCLSVKKEVPGIVPRYDRIKISAYTMDGELIEIKAKGFIAVVIQHEIDHLNGKMFYDKIDKLNPLLPPNGAKPIE